MSIFPFTDPGSVSTQTREVPMAKEYAYDFKANEFLTKEGKLYFVYENEAIKIWIHKALITSRYREVIHTWGYGSEFEDKIIGRGYTKGLIESEAERYTRECINSSLSDYVTNMKNFKVVFKHDTLTIHFTAETIYGEVNVIV